MTDPERDFSEEPTIDEAAGLTFRIVYTGDPAEVDDWIFTFGPVHRHPETGARLADKYVRIRGTFSEARKRMLSMFGIKWSHQSASSVAAEYEREYGTTELPESEWPKPTEPT